jgi:hypothetical protein
MENFNDIFAFISHKTEGIELNTDIFETNINIFSFFCW